jgi:Coatomer subunit gamma-1 C-terminal appendage platform
VEAVLTTLGMAPCEGTDAVPPNARHAPSSLSTMQLSAGRRLEDAVGVDARKMPSPFLCTTRGRKDIVSSTAGSTSGGCVCVVAEVHMAYYAEPLGLSGGCYRDFIGRPRHVMCCRSHMVLLAGTIVGGEQALVRLRFGIDAQRSVAMNLVARSTSPEVSEAVHMIIAE